MLLKRKSRINEMSFNQWRNFGLKSEGNQARGILIKWGSVPPLQKVGVRTPPSPEITPMLLTAKMCKIVV